MGLWDCSRNLGESLHLLSSLILSKPLARPQLFGACLTTHVPSLRADGAGTARGSDISEAGLQLSPAWCSMKCYPNTSSASGAPLLFQCPALPRAGTASSGH